MPTFLPFIASCICINWSADLSDKEHHGDQIIFCGFPMGYGLMASATGRSRALRYVGGAKELTEMEETIWWLESHMYN